MKGLRERRVSSLTDLVDHRETRKPIIKACKSEECILSSEFVISRDILQKGETETEVNVSRSQHSDKRSKVSVSTFSCIMEHVNDKTLYCSRHAHE